MNMSNPTTLERSAPSRNGHVASPEVAFVEKAATPETVSRKRAGTRVLALSGLAAVVLAGALAAGTLPRLRQEREVKAAATEVATARPRVAVVTARQSTPVAARELPGSTLPLLEAGLFPRATGYIKRRLVDIGDRVKEGQLLAEISTPDLDDQLAQAKANLAQARATLKLNQAQATLAQTVLARSVNIRRKGAGLVSQEEIDTERATVGTTRASVESARASIQVNEAAVQRFTDLQQFQKIVAPFSGVITARGIDPGDLVAADSTARELYHLMRTDVLRVIVNVPQVYATGIRKGQGAVVYMREDPSRQFQGKVTRTANALDANTRTLLTEVQVQNPRDELRPGMYLQVKFVFDRQVVPVLIPSAALTTRTGAPKVGVVDARQEVHYRAVQLGRDYGAEVEVSAGLKPGESIVVHPGDDLPEGTGVEPVPAPKGGAGS
jgi:RND family efflux transporter MFP subunit